MAEEYRGFTLIGVALIVLGLLFIVIPLLMRYIPSMEKIPLLLYVYRRGNLYFATSPLLIMISILWIIWLIASGHR